MINLFEPKKRKTKTNKMYINERHTRALSERNAKPARNHNHFYDQQFIIKVIIGCINM